MSNSKNILEEEKEDLLSLDQLSFYISDIVPEPDQEDGQEDNDNDNDYKKDDYDF